MADEKILGVVSGTRDGKLLVVTTPTRCDEPVSGEVYTGLVSGTRNGKPLVAISTQRCGATAGTLEVDRGYLGLVSGTRDGKLLLAVPCGDCGEPCDPTGGCCGCGSKDWPNTLTITIDIACFSSPITLAISNPDPFINPGDGVLPCGESFDGCGEGESWEPGDIVSETRFQGTVSTSGDAGTFSAVDCATMTPVVVDGAESGFAIISGGCIRYVDENCCVKSTWYFSIGVGEQIAGVIRIATIFIFTDKPTVLSSNPGLSTICRDALGEYCEPNAVIEDCDPFTITATGELVCADGSDPCAECLGSSTYTNCVGSAWSVEITE